jgi:hypothetical protein
MSFGKFLLIACALGVGVHYWNQHQAAVALASVMADADENGFITVPEPQGQNLDTVYIVAAVNCPHAAAQRADRLARELTAKGIPVIRTDSVSYSGRLDEPTLRRLNVVMDGPLPIVFLHGRVKSAATLDDVEAEFAAVNLSSPANPD